MLENRKSKSINVHSVAEACLAYSREGLTLQRILRVFVVFVYSVLGSGHPGSQKALTRRYANSALVSKLLKSNSIPQSLKLLNKIL